MRRYSSISLIDDKTLFMTGFRIDFIAEGNTFKNIFELSGSDNIGDDKCMIRLPGIESDSILDFITIFDNDSGTVRNFIGTKYPSGCIFDEDFSIPAGYNQCSFIVCNRRETLTENDSAAFFSQNFRLFG